jgi:putative ABC transport system permease protein
MLMDDESYRAYLRENNLPESEYMGEGAKFPAFADIRMYNRATKRFDVISMFNTGGSLRFPLYSEYGETEGGREISVTFADAGPRNVAVNPGYQMTVIAPLSQIERFELPNENLLSGNITFLSDDPNTTAEQIERMMENIEVPAAYSVINAFAFEEENRRILLVVNIFTYGFIILMSLITVANVFNTITTGISLRRREFAMLKSVGMTDGGLNRMLSYECLFYGFKALMFGLPISFGVTRLIYGAVMQGVDVPFSLPWSSIGIAVSGVFAIVFVTMMYAVNKLKKENVIDALRDDLL